MTLARFAHAPQAVTKQRHDGGGQQDRRVRVQSGPGVMEEQVKRHQADYHPHGHLRRIAHDEVIPEGEEALDILHASLTAFPPVGCRWRNSPMMTADEIP